MSKIPFVTFNNGKKFPIFGLGTWKSDTGKVAQAVQDAVDAGYRHVDCAYVYGNEKEVGDGLYVKLANAEIKREDIYVTSKLWNTFHKPELVEETIKETLQNLKLDYVDLYLMHWPMAYKEGPELFPKDEITEKILYSDVSYLDTWKAMENLVDEGFAKSIGVSNFNEKQIEEILKIARIKPVVNQVECHPYLNQKKLLEFCKSHGIVLTAYSPLGSGDRPWATAKDPCLLTDARLNTLAEKYKKTNAQILLKYQVQRGVIVIPKSVTKERIISNFDIWDFTLSEDDIKEIDTWNTGVRYCHLNWASDHKYYPFKDGEV